VRLGLNLGYWTSATVPADELALVRQAEALGFDSVWAAEAYGSDTVSVLAWLAAQTQRIKLGAAIFQIPARTPAMTAMTAATLDVLSRGRLLMGLGSSGPQVAEGWHGQPFGRQLLRTREYVSVVRSALSGERVAFDGALYKLPLPDGPGKPLKLMISPLQARIPLYLAANGPNNVALAGELADGWMPTMSSAATMALGLEWLADGAARAGRSVDEIEIAPVVPVSPGSDIDAARDAVRPYIALYAGGMGSRERNFYNDLMCRAGFEASARLVQDLYLSGRRAEAEAALPVEYIDELALCGPVERIAAGLERFREAGATTVLAIPVGDRLAAVRALAAAAQLQEVTA
jgi:F420-dependent oxidoreductase-like protein